MDSFLTIQKLDPSNAEINSPVCLKIINNEKGRAVFLNSTKSINTAAILEFMPGADVRGNHYHVQKIETLYIIEGKLELYYWLPSEAEIRKIKVESGDLITIKPPLAHAYKALKRTLAFEVGTHPYDPKDTVYDQRILSEVPQV